ncbi:hypothetical protein D9M69_711140 [compost metagenome]
MNGEQAMEAIFAIEHPRKPFTENHGAERADNDQCMTVAALKFFRDNSDLTNISGLHNQNVPGL